MQSNKEKDELIKNLQKEVIFLFYKLLFIRNLFHPQAIFP